MRERKASKGDGMRRLILCNRTSLRRQRKRMRVLAAAEFEAPLRRALPPTTELRLARTEAEHDVVGCLDGVEVLISETFSAGYRRRWHPAAPGADHRRRHRRRRLSSGRARARGVQRRWSRQRHRRVCDHEHARAQPRPAPPGSKPAPGTGAIATRGPSCSTATCW